MGGNHYVGTEAQMSIFPTKILLATDGSEEASLAARTTVDLANKTNSEIHLVYVTIPLHEPSYYEDIYYYEGISIEDAIAREWREQQRSAQKLLDDQVDKIKGAGGSVAQTHHHTGKPDQQIVELAEELGAGLVVVGSRGLGGIRRALIGSVSDSVVRHAHCPVLVVRKEDQ
jgi:nucleotide-binding universal stress UspA family protein